MKIKPCPWQLGNWSSCIRGEGGGPWEPSWWSGAERWVPHVSGARPGVRHGTCGSSRLTSSVGFRPERTASSLASGGAIVSSPALSASALASTRVAGRTLSAVPTASSGATTVSACSSSGLRKKLPFSGRITGGREGQTMPCERDNRRNSQPACSPKAGGDTRASGGPSCGRR